ncbi:MAG: nucleotidyltransferase domain-containing protein [Candidatus Woesearchaeota archaeon]|jgi:predicted nucleotidyltransferase
MRQKTLMKIVGLMRKELDRGQTMLEISKQLKIGYRPAYNHLIEMGKENMITIEKVGSSNQCKLNLNDAQLRHFLESFDILQKEEIFNKNIKLKLIITNLIEALTEKFISEIHSIVLFGSYAKNNSTKQSDVDLMFVVTDLKNKILREEIDRKCANYQYSHNIKLSPLIVDIPSLKEMISSKGLNVGKEIRTSGISLYGHEMFWRSIS